MRALRKTFQKGKVKVKVADREFDRDQFAERLSNLIKDKKKHDIACTQKRIAERLGITPGYLSNLAKYPNKKDRKTKSNKKCSTPSTPSTDLVVKMSTYFGVSVNFLLFGVKKDMAFQKYSDVLEFIIENFDEEIFEFRTCATASSYQAEMVPKGFHGIIDYEPAQTINYNMPGTVIKINDPIIQYLLDAYRGLKIGFADYPDALEKGIQSLRERFDYPIIHENEDKNFFNAIVRYLSLTNVKENKRYEQALQLFYDSKHDLKKRHDLEKEIADYNVCSVEI